jgi:heme/copper-type cytochrome/quinol oxidase subunit 3
MTTMPGIAAPPLSARQWRMYRGAIWLVILAETMIFVTLFSTRFLLASTERAQGLDQALGIAISVLLIASVFPARWAVRRIARGDGRAMSVSLASVAVVAAVVLALIVYDWVTLGFWAGGRFGENYVLATGYHAFHILVGLIWLSAVATAGRRGRFTPENYWAAEAGVLFWNFVVSMWVLLYVIYFVI